MSPEPADKALLPSSALTLAYYLAAHAGFGGALLLLVLDPSIPGGSFYQPRVIALVHLLTITWLTGSIAGSLYVVGPIALRVPMPVQRADWIAFGAFVFGASGMVAHFWINTYDGMAWSAVFVTAALARVGVRIVRGLLGARIPWAVSLHVALAFVNLLLAIAFGMVLGFDRSRGFLTVSPLSVLFAHVHLAAVGWVTMLVIGVGYRLIPMFLPAQAPAGRSVALSAILLQCGVMVLAVNLSMESGPVWIGVVMIAGGLLSFVLHVRSMLSRRLPRPPALPAHDWSVRQVPIAFLWLLLAAVIGLVLSVGCPDEDRLPLMWIYGVSGLVGFLAQMVASMQGRLVPVYAWYHAYARLKAPPSLPSHALVSERFARIVFVCWGAAVPLLAWGLSGEHHAAIRAGAVFLLAGLGAGGAHLTGMFTRAGRRDAPACP